MLYCNLHFGNLNVETFQLFMVFLEEILGNVHVVVIMDNGPVHIEVSKAFPDINIYFLSSYSPFFNQTEYCFSMFKSSLKQYNCNEVDRCLIERARR